MDNAKSTAPQRIACPLEGCNTTVVAGRFVLARLNAHAHAHAGLVGRLGPELSTYLAQWVAEHTSPAPLVEACWPVTR